MNPSPLTELALSGIGLLLAGYLSLVVLARFNASR